MTRKVIVRRKKFVPPVLPDKPKVTVGSKCYGRSKKGGYIVCRFWITQIWNGVTQRKAKPGDPWFVIDMEEANLASGTKKSGYPEKEAAVRAARRYRDEYGAWYVMPF